ncbi:MAG: helix-turn-helix domain-containing protein [Planctomycetes bacterium]|nr:helix-turn-helix domain-containing protein [Planctomycetota bacterium]NOG53316.1 helix-turn-helix domain-containing protein [Planctomycetota bacterium]
MSVRAHQVLTSAAISGLKRSDLLVLCRILSHLHEKSGEARPSIETLMAKTGLSRRTVQRAIKRLETADIMSIESGKGRGNTSIYRFQIPMNTDIDRNHSRGDDLPANCARSCDTSWSDKASHDGDAVSDKKGRRHDDTLRKPKGRHSNAERASSRRGKGVTQSGLQNGVNGGDGVIAAHRRNPIWDTVVRLFKLNPVTKSDHSRIGRVVHDLTSKRATPEEIEQRLERYRAKWPTMSATPEALVKHWDMFAEPAGILDAEPVDPLARGDL